MNIRKILTPALITMDLKGDSKEAVIANLLQLLVDAGKIPDREDALKAVLERESRMSTGIQAGIAIPHGKCASVTELAACVGICREGVDFEALDGIDSNIFIMTISPIDRTGPHVQFLAEISRLLKEEDIRKKLIRAGSPAEVLDLLTG